jgi:hypothetical protein
LPMTSDCTATFGRIGRDFHRGALL